MTGHYHICVCITIILTTCNSRIDSNQTGASDAAVTYENFSLQLPTGQQPVKPAKEDDVNLEQNPSYAAVDCINLQVKPVANTVTEENLYYDVQ